MHSERNELIPDDPTEDWPEPTSIDTLRAVLDSTVPTYLLIDPIVGEPIPGETTATSLDALTEQRAQLWQRSVLPVALDPKVPLALHQHPYLVALSGIDDPLLETSLLLAQAEREAAQADGLDGTGVAVHRIGGWLQCAQRPDVLSARLSALMRVNTRARTSARYLRLADRRVLALLTCVAGTERVAAQLGPIARWAYLDAQARIETLEPAQEMPESLLLEAKEWLQMEAGELVHRAMAQWLGELARNHVARLPQASAQSLFPRFWPAISNADDAARSWPHRFPDLADRAVWTALVLIEPRLANGRVVRDLLDPRGSEDAPAEPLRYLHAQIQARFADMAVTAS